VFLLGASLGSLRSQMKGFHDLLREKPTSLLMLLRWSLISIASMMILYIYLDLLDRILVLCSWIQWPRFMLCSAKDVHDRCVGGCSLALVSIERPVCLMYTFPHSQGMLYTPGVFKARWSLMGRRKLESFLGGNPS
jgi:hypothetical protein